MEEIIVIILANTTTREILGYATVGSFDSDENTVVFSWSGMTPEPTHEYYLVGTQVPYSVARKLDSEIDSERRVRLWRSVRDERDRRLIVSDGIAARQAEQDTLNATQWTAFKQYRQALRDIPENQSDPSNITWPTWPL